MQDTIKINGKEYPIVFNWKTVKVYEKESEESYYDALTGLTAEPPKATTLVALVYAALVAGGCREFDVETLYKHTLKLGADTIYAITVGYLNSLPKPDDQPQTDQTNTEAPGERTGLPSKGAQA